MCVCVCQNLKVGMAERTLDLMLSGVMAEQFEARPEPKPECVLRSFAFSCVYVLVCMRTCDAFMCACMYVCALHMQ